MLCVPLGEALHCAATEWRSAARICHQRTFLFVWKTASVKKKKRKRKGRYKSIAEGLILSLRLYYLLIKSFTSVAIVSSCWSFNFFISLMIASSLEGLEESKSKNSLGVTPKYSQMKKFRPKMAWIFPSRCY